MNTAKPLVGVVMGSDSDWSVMRLAAEALTEFGIPFEADVVSAHRMPDEMIDYGMLASVTPLPVIGVPVPLKTLDGMDSLLSIVQMPAGVPVATVSIGGARNAGLLAVRTLASGTDELATSLRSRLVDFADELRQQASAKGDRLRQRLTEEMGLGS